EEQHLHLHLRLDSYTTARQLHLTRLLNRRRRPNNNHFTNNHFTNNHFSRLTRLLNRLLYRRKLHHPLLAPLLHHRRLHRQECRYSLHRLLLVPHKPHQQYPTTEMLYW
ncbi:hypothetical protein JL09_g6519, partial [Pichia kudriavzevii]